MNEFDLFLRRSESGSTPRFVEDLTSWDQLVTGRNLMNGRDFSRLAQYDLPKAMAFLVGFATSFPMDKRPNSPEELLGLVDWETPEAAAEFVNSISERVIK